MYKDHYGFKHGTNGDASGSVRSQIDDHEPLPSSTSQRNQRKTGKRIELVSHLSQPLYEQSYNILAF